MANNTFLTASHIRYLLALKKLNAVSGIKSVAVAKTLGLSKVSVHNMMDTFLVLRYIEKEHGGLVFLTEHGLQMASLFESYHSRLKEKLFVTDTTDPTADMAIYAFLAELSEQSFEMLV